MLKKPHKFRVLLIGSIFCGLAAIVAGRLFDLQFIDHAKYQAKANDRQTMKFVVQPERGDIVDRQGRLLATSTGTLSVYVWPRYFRTPEAEVDLAMLATQISHYSGMPRKNIVDRLSGDSITHIGRQLDPEVAQKIFDLMDSAGVSRRGFWFERESKRSYPRKLGSHVIGFTGTDGSGDNLGRAGLELGYNSEISGQRIEGRTTRTGIRQAMEPIPPKDLLDARGHTLILTLDAAIQEAAEAAVARSAVQYEADAVGAVVQDTETGAILAMASWPDFDNSEFGGATAEARRNRILTDPMETGSVAKLFTAAMLLDSGRVQLDTIIDCEGGRAVIGPRVVRDAPGHYLGRAPFLEVIRHSSNVGTIKAAQVFENEEWYHYLRAFGLGAPAGIDLPGEGTGILRHFSRWDKYSRISLPMGYEMSLTSLQIVNGITGIVNGGELLEPYIVAEIRDSRDNVIWKHPRTVKNRMIRPATSVLMRQVMEDVVESGTGKKAQVPGFRVGGKTGTTQKSHVFTHKEYIASFAGVLPIDQPRVAIYCFVDNPHGAHYASEVAAPLFQEIAAASVLHLGLVPTLPVDDNAKSIASKNAPVPEEFAPAMTAPEAVRRGLMPDFRGMTMAEVRPQMPSFLERIRFVGSGRVADQTPPAGAPLESTAEIVLVFQPAATRPDTAEQLAAQTRSTPR